MIWINKLNNIKISHYILIINEYFKIHKSQAIMFLIIAVINIFKFEYFPFQIIILFLFLSIFIAIQNWRLTIFYNTIIFRIFYFLLFIFLFSIIFSFFEKVFEKFCSHFPYFKALPRVVFCFIFFIFTYFKNTTILFLF